ncbi:MAG: hypothetical protein HXX16_00095 [Bacteroidales bacterium]|nr:hypothetical protein [Bacteroidales bacterium]
MDYQTLYEYQPVGFGFGRLLFLLVLSILGYGLAYYTKKSNVKYSLQRQVYIFTGYLICGFFAIFIIVNLSKIPRIIVVRRDFYKIVESKNYSVVEGETKDYCPMSLVKQDNVRYTVNGIPFIFTDFTIPNDVYHGIKINTGPITRNGQKVRISYITSNEVNYIFKIEIKK